MLITSTEAVVYIASHGDVGCLTVHRPLELGIFVLDNFQASTIEFSLLIVNNFQDSTIKLGTLLLSNF